MIQKDYQRNLRSVLVEVHILNELIYWINMNYQVLRTKMDNREGRIPSNMAAWRIDSEKKVN